MVARTRHNATLYIHCLSCNKICWENSSLVKFGKMPGTIHENLNTFMTISSWILPKWEKEFPDRSLDKIKIHFRGYVWPINLTTTISKHSYNKFKINLTEYASNSRLNNILYGYGLWTTTEIMIPLDCLDYLRTVQDAKVRTNLCLRYTLISSLVGFS
jgi:hypothetical protein